MAKVKGLWLVFSVLLVILIVAQFEWVFLHRRRSFLKFISQLRYRWNLLCAEKSQLISLLALFLSFFFPEEWAVYTIAMTLVWMVWIVTFKRYLAIAWLSWFGYWSECAPFELSALSWSSYFAVSVSASFASSSFWNWRRSSCFASSWWRVSEAKFAISFSLHVVTSTQTKKMLSLYA